MHRSSAGEGPQSNTLVAAANAGFSLGQGGNGPGGGGAGPTGATGPKGAPNFDVARRAAFEKAGMNDPGKVDSRRFDPKTGTSLNSRGPDGAKVGTMGARCPGPLNSTTVPVFGSTFENRTLPGSFIPAFSKAARRGDIKIGCPPLDRWPRSALPHPRPARSLPAQG